MKKKLHDLEADYKSFKSDLGVSIIHGDAHPGNVISSNNKLFLCDFDSISVGELEWDLVVPAMAIYRFGLEKAVFDNFSKSYGYNILSHPHANTVLKIRELGTIAWLCLNHGLSDEINLEINHRLQTLKNNDETALWNAF